MDDSPLGVAVIGCGDIAAAYGASLAGKPGLLICGGADRNPPRRERFVADWGGRAYASVNELLSDPAVDIVVNLTRQAGHFDVTRAALRAGKHVYSEKPIALTRHEADELAALADRSGVRLACAPITYLGAAQQAALGVLRSGALGTVRVVYAEANWGWIERWHPRPQDFYASGPVLDVGVYPLTLVTAFLGPAVEVRASGAVLHAARRTTTGEAFDVPRPDFVTAVVELASGPLVRLTCSFYVDLSTRQKGLEVHGDDAALHLDSWFYPNSVVSIVPRGGQAETVPVPGEPAASVDWASGVADLAAALRADRPHLASAAHATHVVEIVESIHRSVEVGRPVRIDSSFPAPFGTLSARS